MGFKKTHTQAPERSRGEEPRVASQSSLPPARVGTCSLTYPALCCGLAFGGDAAADDPASTFRQLSTTSGFSSISGLIYRGGSLATLVNGVGSQLFFWPVDLRIFGCGILLVWTFCTAAGQRSLQCFGGILFICPTSISGFHSQDYNGDTTSR